MNWNHVCGLVVLAGCATGSSESDSQGIKDVERMNEGVFERRVAHFKGSDAMLFIALDPVWSTPDFHNVPFRHPEDMKLIRRQYQGLLQQDIDEVVVWKFRRGGLAAAVPFSSGSTVDGYGEPDHLSKLMIMRDTLLLIDKNGLDHASVRSALKRLLMTGRFESSYDDSMIDIMIRRIRPVIAKGGAQPGGVQP